MTFDVKCIGCGKCAQICSAGAITIDEQGRKIDRGKCDLCLKCAEACVAGAITIAGKYLSINEVMKVVEADKLFYQNSGGGMTISGGEPLMQLEFVGLLFKACKQRGIHTALDTTGFAPWERINKVLDYVDLALYDLKHMNCEIHKLRTGVSNELILSNIAKTASRVRTWLRIPVIPGFNDSDFDIQQIAEFSHGLAVEKISILPFHSWGESKYERLGLIYRMRGIYPPPEERIKEIREIIESYGLKTAIGR